MNVSSITRRDYSKGVAVALMLFAVACSDVSRPAGPTAGIAQHAISPSTAVRSSSRGIEDVFLELDRQIPGFGGFSMDANGDVVAFIKDASRASAASAAVTAWLESNTDVFLRARPARVIMKTGKFGFTDLVKWQTAVGSGQTLADEITMIDADESQDRVKVLVRSAHGLSRIPALAEKMGVPLDAIVAEVSDFTVTNTTLTTSTKRPTDGGLVLSYQRTFSPDTFEICTLGFNVTVGAGMYALTASHCNYTYTGLTGNTWRQAINIADAIGTASNNPAWSTTGCLYPGAVYCRNTDAMLISYNNFSNAEKKIAETTVVGTTLAGSTTIGTYYGVTNPQLSSRMMGDTLFKTGALSGTTKGPVVNSCFIAPPDSAFHSSVQCAYMAQMYDEPGDSGGPVYYWRIPFLSTVRVPEGITFGRGKSAGVTYTLYTFWSDIETDLSVTMVPY